MDRLEKPLDSYIDSLTQRYPQLLSVRDQIVAAYKMLESCYAQGGKLLIAGNGGSAADAQHIVGELMKQFCLPRPVLSTFREKLTAIDPERGSLLARNLHRALPAIALSASGALHTAYCNDVDAQSVYAQQVFGYGRPGDVFLALTTSGNSENVLQAAIVAKAMGIPVIGLTGQKESALSQIADVAVCVPETEAYRIQELHLPIYHCLCLMLEARFFGE